MQWVDSRVSANLTNSSKDHIQIPGHIKDFIWFPDIYILNSRKVEVPTHTWEPKYTLVFQNGEILTSILTRAEIGCPMNFLDYPVSKCILIHRHNVPNAQFLKHRLTFKNVPWALKVGGTQQKIL